ncbi:MAG TPA: SMC-Scp complex subunit ScpB [Actinomycetota bacterium]|jgi:segregation and condensation protein B
MTRRDARARGLEAILFVADEPLSAGTLAAAVDAERPEVEADLERLAASYLEESAGIVLRNVAGGWRLYTNPDAASVVERFILASRHTRLTKAALETLSIVAYKQPVTRHHVAAIRGVNSDGVLKALTDRGLLAEVGRDEGPGRPLLYGTTPEFLERLGLPSVKDLPPLAPLLGEDEEAAGGDGDVRAAD